MRPTPVLRLSRRSLIAGSVATALAFASRARAEGSGPKLLIYWVSGGWDPTYVYDPHFGTDVATDPEGSAATIGALTFADAASRPSVRAFLERWGHRSAFVNGVAVGSISHETCTRLILTGRRDDAPDFPTRIAAAAGSSFAAPHVVLGGPRYPGDLGAVVTTFNRTFAETAAGRLPTDRDPDREARIQAWLMAEAAAIPGPRVSEYRQGLERLATLQAYAVDTALSESPTEADQVGVIADLFARDLSRTAILQGDTANVSQWDSHVGNDFNQDRCFEHLFSQLSALMDTLSGTPASGGGTLADEVVVAVMSEMGRHPVMNSGEGKDHWPYTSALFIGPGVTSGVYGASDPDMLGAPCDPVSGEASDAGELLTVEHLCATILSAFDIDPAEAGFDVASMGFLG